MPTENITAVTIAQDALKLLDLRRLVATSNTYLDTDAALGTDLKGLLHDNGGSECMVCALGAVFCGLVYTTDEVKVSNASSYRMMDLLEPYFPHNQLIDIEAAFEKWGRMGTATYRQKRGLHSLLRDEEAIRAILHNIIEGNGVFDPRRKETTHA